LTRRAPTRYYAQLEKNPKLSSTKNPVTKNFFVYFAFIVVNPVRESSLAIADCGLIPQSTNVLCRSPAGVSSVLYRDKKKDKKK
jgi:hypothetical protein